MPSPFDFLGNLGNTIGSDVQGAEQGVGNWLKGLLPSQPAQPSNQGLPSPTSSIPPVLTGMIPGVGTFASGANALGDLTGNKQAQNWGTLFNDPAQFAHNVGLDKLGQSMLTTDFTQNNPVANVADQLGGARDLAGQDLVQGGMNPRLAKSITNPFGYIGDVLNAGLVDPINLARNPEMWFAENDNSQYLKGYDPGTAFYNNVILGRNHNYLRDVFAPVVKAITGEDVPHTTLYYQQMGDQLNKEGAQLEQVRSNLTPQSSQQDIDAYNNRLQAWQNKSQNYQMEYQKSADWWQNSNIAKTMRVVGAAVTFPAGFAAGAVTFLPQLFESPTGTATGMIQQVQQAGLFVQKLANSDERAKITSQEWADNITNIAMLGGMLYGAKGMTEGITGRGISHDTLTAKGVLARDQILEGLKQSSPELHNPIAGPTARVDELKGAHATPSQVPGLDEQRVADLESQIPQLQKQLSESNDPGMKKAIQEQIYAARDEVNMLQGVPKPSPPDLEVPRTRGYAGEGSADIPAAGYAPEINRPFDAESQIETTDPERLSDQGLIDEIQTYTQDPDWEGPVSDFQRQVIDEAIRRGLTDEAGSFLGPAREEQAPTPRSTVPFSSTSLMATLDKYHSLIDFSKPVDLNGLVQPLRQIAQELTTFGDSLADHPESGKDDSVMNMVNYLKNEITDATYDIEHGGVDGRRILVNTRTTYDALKKAVPSFLSSERTKMLGDVGTDIGREMQELPPKTTKAVHPFPAFEDYQSEVLGKTFSVLKPRPEDFSANATAALSRDRFENLNSRALRDRLRETRFTPTTIEKLRGNGWIHPDGWAVSIGSFDNNAHQEFFTEVAMPGDERDPRQVNSDLMDKGWIKKSTIAGMVQFGVHGLDRGKLDSIQQAMRADYKKGIPQYPYQIADEKTGQPAYEITPQEFAANDFMLGRIMQRLQNRGMYRAEASGDYMKELDVRGGALIGMDMQGETGKAGTQDVVYRPADGPDVKFNLADLPAVSPNKVRYYRVEDPTMSEDTNYGNRGQWFFKTPQDAIGFLGYYGTHGDDARMFYVDVPSALDRTMKQPDSKNQVTGSEYVLPREWAYRKEEIKGEKLLGKQNISAPGAPGQAGETGISIEGRDRPEGSPEGSYLASTFQPAEGQAPVAIWQTRPESVSSVRESGQSRLASLFKQAINDAISQAIQLGPDQKPLEWKEFAAQQEAAIMKEGIGNFIERRKAEFGATAAKVWKKYDPDGLVRHIFMDPSAEGDAYFAPMHPKDAIFWNPLKGNLVSWAHYRGLQLKDSLATIQEDLTPAQYSSILEYINSWIHATQEQLDEMAVAEELGHAYEMDHMPNDETYLRWQLYKPQEWRDHAIKSGLATSMFKTPGDPTGWRNSILGIVNETINGGVRFGRGAKKLAMRRAVSDLAEYNANQIKNWHKTPLSGYSYRVPEAFIAEMKDPSLINEGAIVGGKYYETVLRPKVQAYVAEREARSAQNASLPAQQAGATAGLEAQPGGATGDVAVAGAPAAASTAPTIGFGGPTSPDQTGVAAVQPKDIKDTLGNKLTIEALLDLEKSGWPKRWEDFVRQINLPEGMPGWNEAKPYFDKLSKGSKMLFGQSKLLSSAKREPLPEPTPEVKPQEVNNPAFQADQLKIKNAELKIKAAGKKIDGMYKAGESQGAINQEKASLEGLQTYVDAKKSGLTEIQSVKLARSASAKELERLGTESPQPDVPVFDEEGKVRKGKAYAKLSDANAKVISDRLRNLGYDMPLDVKGFIDDLFGQSRTAEKIYRQLPPTTKEILARDVGYEGIKKRTKASQAETQTTVSTGKGEYINPVNDTGLRQVVQRLEDNGVAIIRHGETDHNKDGKIRSDLNVPLNDAGLDQAVKIAEAFKGKKIAYIVTSDLTRAHVTADAIAKVTGAKVIVNPDLRPWKLGELKGTSAAAAVPILREYIHDKPDVRVPGEGGESFNEFKNRYLTALSQYMEAAKNQPGATLIVAHTRNMRLTKDWINAGQKADSMDFKALDAKEEVSPGGIMTLARQGDGFTVAGEASQGGDKATPVQQSRAQAPVQTPTIQKDPVEIQSDNIRKNAKAITDAREAISKVTGEIARKLDLTAEIDGIAADPAHPANLEAMQAKVAKDMMPEAKKMGAASYTKAQENYAAAVDKLSQKLATLEQEKVAAAPLTAPAPMNQAVFSQTLLTAKALQVKLDKGADPNDIAVEAAKSVGLSLAKAKSALMNERDGTVTAFTKTRAQSWSPAFKDLILGKAAKVVRKAKLSDRPTRGILPLEQHKLLGAEKVAVGPKPGTPKPRKLIEPAVSKTLRQKTPTGDIPKPKHPKTSVSEAKAQVEAEVKVKKTTRELREETQQIHKKINTPSPNPFKPTSWDQYSQIIEDMKDMKNPKNWEPASAEMARNLEDAQAARERGAKAPYSPPGGGKEPPPPGDILGGWDDARDDGRGHGGDIEDLANRMDLFLKNLVERTDPGRNTYHPTEQAMAYVDNTAADLHRIKGISDLMRKVIPQDSLDVSRRISAAVEGSDAKRLAAREKLNPQEQAIADLLHADFKVRGKLGSSADRELFEDMVDHYLPHRLKFDEFGNKISLDSNGKPKSFSPKYKLFKRRMVDKETGKSLYETTQDLVKEFGENNVEEDLPTLWTAHAESYVKMLRMKELRDDLSGHYVRGSKKYTGSFTEQSIKPGFKNIGGRGLTKENVPYQGYAVVPETEYASLPQEYKDQLDRVTIGPTKASLAKYWVYKPVKDELERLAPLWEGANNVEKAANFVAHANGIYKVYKFGFNPIHLYNLISNVSAMFGKGLGRLSPNPSLLKNLPIVGKAIPSMGLYDHTYGRLDRILTGKDTWKTPIGEFAKDEVIAQLVKRGAVLKDKIIDSANLGGLQGVFAKVPGFTQWHDHMWHEVAWKGHLAVALHLSDVMTSEFTKKFGQPPSAGEWENIMRIAIENSKYAMGFIDRSDMSRDWQVYGNSLLFANSWSLGQLRMSGKALYALNKNIPGAELFKNLGGGEKYTDVVSAMMKDMGGITQEHLDWVNSRDGKIAQQLMFGGMAKLMAVSIAMSYIGSAIATGSPTGPWDNFQRDPTHTFDIYLGTDPTTQKDLWQHNPLYGMQQEVALWFLAAVRAHNDNQDPTQVALAPVVRYLNKANPVLTTGLDVLLQRNLQEYFQGYGDKSDLSADKNIIAIQRALDAKGISLPTGLMDSIIYAVRQLAPMPGFAPEVANQTNMTPGDISNAFGPGQILGAGDIWNAVQTGDIGSFIKKSSGGLLEYALGSRQSTSATPDQIAGYNQATQAAALKDAKDQSITDMLNAAKRGDYTTVYQIANQLQMDNSQLTEALTHPPSGTGAGILYQNLPFNSNPSSPVQDSIMGVTLRPEQTAEFEHQKMIYTLALVQDLQNDPQFVNGNQTTRTEMLNSLRSIVDRAATDAYAQSMGLLGGQAITPDNIQSMIQNALVYRDMVQAQLANFPVYQTADPVTQQEMEAKYQSFATTLAWDATYGNLQGVPPQYVGQILSDTINTEESSLAFLKRSVYWQLASGPEQQSMLNEYSSLARTIAKRAALQQGQGPRQDELLRPQDTVPIMEDIINVEETAKGLLHGTDYYLTADVSVQQSLDTKYANMARSLAFPQTPNTGDPYAIIYNSIAADQQYYGLQDQFGGTNYIKLMAQQLSDMQLTLRQGADYSPQQIAAMERGLRAQFLAQNPTYAAYLQARTAWTKNTVEGQIYQAVNNSEYAAIDDLSNAGVQPSDSILQSGVPGVDTSGFTLTAPDLNSYNG